MRRLLEGLALSATIVAVFGISGILLWFALAVPNELHERWRWLQRQLRRYRRRRF